MDYFCNNCKKKYGFDIEVKYCPFCGKSYQAEDFQVKPDTLRIVISSDGERTIENLYWDESKDCLSKIKENMQSRSSELGERVLRILGYIPIPEEIGEYISAGESEPSVRIKNYIRKIEKIFEEIEKNPEQFVVKAVQAQDLINKERTTIINTCKKVMSVLRFEEQIDFENHSLRKKEEEFSEDTIRLNRYDYPKYNHLLQVIHDSIEKIRNIINDDANGFNIPYAESLPKEEAEECDPNTLSRELVELSEIDYDFIFGESPDQFILKFWDCIIYLAYIANEMLDDQYVKACTEISTNSYEEKMDCEIAALIDAVSGFSKKMDIQLDKLYRSQSADMLDVQLSLSKILEDCIADENL